MAPLYDYECQECLKQNAVLKPISKIDDLELCCDQPMFRIIQVAQRFCTFDMQRRASIKRVMKKKMEAERKK